MLKDGKSAGIDNIHAELLKYGPKEISKEIADIYNEIAETGEFQEEIKKGMNLSSCSKTRQESWPI